MKTVPQYMKNYIPAYALAILSMLISVSLDMLSPQLTKRIIDDVILNGQMEKLRLLLLGIFAVGLGRCIFQYTKEYTFDAVSVKITSVMRQDLFSHIQTLSARFFDKTNTGELMTRVKDDIDKVWAAIGYVGMLALEVCIHTCIVLFCMYRLHWKLALLPSALMLFLGAAAIMMEKKLGAVYGSISEETALLNTVAQENLAGVRTVKAFAREKFEITKFLSHNKRYYSLNMEQSRIFTAYYPLFQLATKILPLGILLCGGLLVMREEMTLGSLGAFVEYSMNIVWPMEMLGWLSNDIASAAASLQKIRQIYENKPDIKEAAHPVCPGQIYGDVSFSHVSFQSEDGNDILSDISFSLKAGQTLGIMGATGSGKTSIANLLQRMYDATSGSIRIDGVDIKELSLAALRGNIAVVMQDVFLFSDTITENVKLGKRGMVDAALIRSSSRLAQADGFIEKMEAQYDTVIGERGIGLSGGEKQRISIARALAKKCPILVLDDATSALDMETQHFIQRSLKELADTTKIIIAHRVSAVYGADEIIVLDNGTIKERGTHAQLLAAKGHYYQTYQLQYASHSKQEEEKEAQDVVPFF